MIITTATSGFPTFLRTIEEFEAWEKQQPHEGSYEFVRGRIIPKPSMKQEEFYIADFLTRKFIRTKAFEAGHTLMAEGDSYIDNVRKRIPDLTYTTAQQHKAIRCGERINTFFAIEILSESESYDDVLEKLQDYFDGGTKLVWYIIPKRRKIFAYTSPDESKAYKEQDVISASPLLPDFSFTVSDLFA
ncbi:hypothetical protein BLX24_15035 [Arsenicibacter rosenii]|uniref:Putative restriction endonuclease domain-containing protein n=2 Tax=Arsenicibacter rosenii TaxID=1750698 RepID=A0A1S2VHU8_9BACT|nr:hypothetical protein BLX24_15035 [Arsenicibacter rosenii]